MAGLLGAGSREDGLCRRRRAHRRRRALDGGRDRVRRDRARRDAAGARRVRRVPAAARERSLDAGAHAHRARLGRRPGRWSRRGRGRLPHEAVLVRRAARAAARARRAGLPSSGRRSSRSATSALDPATRQVWRGDVEIDLSSKEFALLETFMRRPGSGALAPPAARALLGLRLREPLERRGRLRPLPAREDRSAVRPRSIETVRGAGYRLRKRAARAPESVADPGTAHRSSSRSPWRSCSRRSARSSTCASARRSTRQSTKGFRREAPRWPARFGAMSRSPPAVTPTSASSRSSMRTATSPQPPASGDTLLDAEMLTAARRDATWLLLDDVHGVDGRVRVLATPFETAGGRLVVVVGSSLENRDDAVHGLLTLLLIVGPAALLVASLLGYGLATLALRPVESMRVEANVISASEPGRRLPLPRANDEISRLGETLNRMLERLETALERERSFVADASHELRTPIALLKTELELALRRPRSEAELENALRSAATEADRLAKLADNLLVIARFDDGALSRPGSNPCERARRERWSALRAAYRGRGPEHRAGRPRDTRPQGRPTPARAGFDEPRRQRAPPR